MSAAQLADAVPEPAGRTFTAGVARWCAHLLYGKATHVWTPLQCALRTDGRIDVINDVRLKRLDELVEYVLDDRHEDEHYRLGVGGVGTVLEPFPIHTDRVEDRGRELPWDQPDLASDQPRSDNGDTSLYPRSIVVAVQ